MHRAQTAGLGLRQAKTELRKGEQRAHPHLPFCTLDSLQCSFDK